MDGEVWIQGPKIPYAPSLEDVHLHLNPGEVLGIFGPSGIGKTSLLRGLAGLIQVDGVTCRGRVSMVFQENRLLEGFSLRDNLAAVGGDLKRGLVLARDLGLEDAFDKDVSLYSGGMQRRAALIRALAVPFDLLLLDEAFREVDEETKGQMLKQISALKETVIFTSHDPEDARALEADQILNLKE